MLLLGSFCGVTPGNESAAAQANQISIYLCGYLALAPHLNPFLLLPSLLGPEAALRACWDLPCGKMVTCACTSFLKPLTWCFFFPCDSPLFFFRYYLELLFQFLNVEPLHEVPQFPGHPLYLGRPNTWKSSMPCCCHPAINVLSSDCWKIHI